MKSPSPKTSGLDESDDPLIANQEIQDQLDRVVRSKISKDVWKELSPENDLAVQSSYLDKDANDINDELEPITGELSPLKAI